ncbi:MAG TPA: crossover junction endodeoxyribonuclease RuvC [Caulobacteraceae bacterium]|nr:crossover junction endodeoxyribonuclease RuvC [Caulobacteraceae bacterium]
MTNAIRILGLDPGLRRTGWGVVAAEGSRLTHVAHGVIAPDDRLALAERLLALFHGVQAVIAEHGPHEAAVEETFMTANGASTLKLGHARAAVMIAPAAAGLPVAEYAAKVVKKAIVGTGSAEKDQVAFMIARLLPTAGAPTADAADALAVAIAHVHGRTLIARGYGGQVNHRRAHEASPALRRAVRRAAG